MHAGQHVALALKEGIPHLLAMLLSITFTLNLLLFTFNLLPIPPLDGGAVLAWVLPRSWQGVVDFLQRYGAFMLLLLVLSPMLGLPILGIVMYPMAVLIRLWHSGLVWAINL